MKKAKILVTGGSGFIGSSLVRRLIKEGEEVRVLDNLSRGTRNHLSDVLNQVELIDADIRDANSVQDACKGVNRVYHLAFINGTEFFYSKPELVLDVGVKGMVNILDGCQKEGIRELFLASSSEVYQSPPTVPTDETAPLIVPDPMNPRYSYGAGKIISEIMTINYGRKNFDRVVIFRPHNVYGPNMGWEHVIPQLIVKIKALIKKSSDRKISLPIQGTGQETRAFVYIDDFTDGLMILNDKGKHLNIYHVGNDEEISIALLAKEIGKYYGKEIDVVPGETVKGGTQRRCPNISKLRALGYNPHIRLAEGLPRMIEWYDQHIEAAPADLVSKT